MIRQGPIPRLVHGIIEYLAAVLFIVAPFLLSFDGPATAVSIVAGLLVLIVAATTEGPTSLINTLPLPAHILIDYAFAALLVASPFLFGFSHETNATAFFIALGVVHLLVTIATQFKGENEAPRPLT